MIVSNLLGRDRLAVYEGLPDHQRAKPLRPTARGRRALVTIFTAQRHGPIPWARRSGRLTFARSTRYSSVEPSDISEQCLNAHHQRAVCTLIGMSVKS